MCLLTTQQKALRAKEDIIVYKLFVHEDDELLKAPFQYFYYPKLGRQKTIPLGVKKDTIGYGFNGLDSQQAFIDKKNGKKINTISQGYHSCKIKGNLLTFVFPNRTLYKCIIPKGAWYYQGYYGLMVSTDLIIGEKC